MKQLFTLTALILLFGMAATPIQGQKNELIVVDSIAYDMILVHGGSFEMGATQEQTKEAYRDEYPSHKVTLSDYYIGKYEVTVAQFEQFIQDSGYKTEADRQGESEVWDNARWVKRENVNWKCDVSGKPRNKTQYNHPVIHISWNDAEAFCQWISQKTGKKFRLPTEAEWEYAARGGKESRQFIYSGSNNANSVGYFHENNGVGTMPIGTKKPNELGIYDMSGNVWEWCYDYKRTYNFNSQHDPQGATKGTLRTRRGGSWISPRYCCRVSDRNNSTPGRSCSYIGFRLAASIK